MTQLQFHLFLLNFKFLTKNFHKIPAHKFAIVVASEVFQKEFTYSDGAEEAHKRSKTLQVLNRSNLAWLYCTLYNQVLRTQSN